MDPTLTYSDAVSSISASKNITTLLIELGTVEDIVASKNSKDTQTLFGFDQYHFGFRELNNTTKNETHERLGNYNT